MNCSNSLNDPSTCAVLDTSVVINLNATGCATKILEALPNRFVVVEQVVSELENGRRNGHPGSDGLSSLTATGHIKIVRLGDNGWSLYAKLVDGTAAETLDDGEAATIAYGVEQKALPIIDDRKAKKLCAKHFASVGVACTIEILAHKQIHAALGRHGLEEALFNALQRGRMSVPPELVEWIRTTIGSERAAQCPSLPKGVRIAKSALK